MSNVDLSDVVATPREGEREYHWDQERLERAVQEMQGVQGGCPVFVAKERGNGKVWLGFTPQDLINLVGGPPNQLVLLSVESLATLFNHTISPQMLPKWPKQ